MRISIGLGLLALLVFSLATTSTDPNFALSNAYFATCTLPGPELEEIFEYVNEVTELMDDIMDGDGNFDYPGYNVDPDLDASMISLTLGTGVLQYVGLPIILSILCFLMMCCCCLFRCCCCRGKKMGYTKKSGMCTALCTYVLVLIASLGFAFWVGGTHATFGLVTTFPLDTLEDLYDEGIVIAGNTITTVEDFVDTNVDFENDDSIVTE
ncbi:hypothetical protein KIPB_007711, partial [Kipferlia bialata]|eukprot:g7711.t1